MSRIVNVKTSFAAALAHPHGGDGAAAGTCGWRRRSRSRWQLNRELLRDLSWSRACSETNRHNLVQTSNLSLAEINVPGPAYNLQGEVGAAPVA